MAARDIQYGAPKNEGNAPEVNYQLMKFSVELPY
jgi:hypothetical protein